MVNFTVKITGADEVKRTKQAYGWPADETFLVPQRALAHMQQAVALGAELEAQWSAARAEFRTAHPQLAAQLDAALRGELPDGWDAGIPEFPTGSSQATRAVSSWTEVTAVKGRYFT